MFAPFFFQIKQLVPPPPKKKKKSLQEQNGEVKMYVRITWNRAYMYKIFVVVNCETQTRVSSVSGFTRFFFFFWKGWGGGGGGN